MYESLIKKMLSEGSGWTGLYIRNMFKGKLLAISRNLLALERADFKIKAPKARASRI